MKRNVLKLYRGQITKKEEKIRVGKENDEDQKKVSWALAQAMDLGLSIALPIVAGAFFGRYLDDIFGTAPKLTLVFLFLGVIIGSVRIVKLAREDAV